MGRRCARWPQAISAGLYHNLILINGGWPYITGQPVSQTVQAGANVTLATAAIGQPILYFQWELNGTNMIGATNFWLTLTNVPVGSAGDYVCIASNVFGTVFSSTAILNVLRTTPYFENSMQFGKGTLGLELNGLSGHGSVIIYASTNMVNWISIFTNPPRLREKCSF